MDLSDLLLLLIFVAFPLLQQLLSRRGSSEAPPRDPEGVEPAAPEDRVPLPRFPTGHPERAPWEAEPPGELRELEEVEALAGREVVDEEEAAELVRRRARLPEAFVPEAVRVSVPVVSMEPLRVDRSGPRPVRVMLAPARVNRVGPARADALLRGPDGLRRAVLLTEILGPPGGLGGR